MALTSEQTTRLEQIEAILAAGVSVVVSETGRQIRYDLDALRLERDRLLQASVGASVGSRFRRVVLS